MTMSDPNSQIISKAIEPNKLKQKFVKNCSLEKALEYQNNDIIHQFTTLWEVSFEEAEELFVETKKWLWLTQQADDQTLSIIAPMLMIDEMWHNFMLFSRDYTKYCQNCFGHYIHHGPTTHSEKEAMKKAALEDPTDTAEKTRQKNMQQILLIYQKLGIETLLKWYLEYPEKYNQDFFDKSSKSKTMSYTLTDEMQNLITLFKKGRLVVRK